MDQSPPWDTVEVYTGGEAEYRPNSHSPVLSKSWLATMFSQIQWGVHVALGVGDGVYVGPGVYVAVGVGVMLGVYVLVGVSVMVGVRVIVGVGVCVGTAVGWSQDFSET
jgi:hypothetical protein